MRDVLAADEAVLVLVAEIVLALEAELVLVSARASVAVRLVAFGRDEFRLRVSIKIFD